MNCFKVKWASLRETVYETEESEAKFRERMFGHPARLPDGVTFEVLEAKNATQTGKVEESDLGKHQDRDGGRPAAKAGGGNRHVKGGAVKEQKQEEGQVNG